MSGGYRVDVMHGVNLDMLGSRDPEVYGTFTLSELEGRVSGYAAEVGLTVAFYQTNHEGEFCEELHQARERADALIVNAGAWTHYSYAIRDALEVCALPAVEVHISAVSQRDDWRRHSVIRDLCIGAVEGKGLEGYREALGLLEQRLAS
jgi:3-dehydroquinate dehydratase-2